MLSLIIKTNGERPAFADIEDKLNKLEYFIRSFKADFVVIDGIRGFTYDINNSSEATKIINFLSLT